MIELNLYDRSNILSLLYKMFVLKSYKYNIERPKIKRLII